MSIPLLKKGKPVMNVRKTIGLIAAAAAMIGLAAPAAQAAEPATTNTMIPTADLAKAQSLTVSSTIDITGKTLKAIQLARYSAAQTDGTNITGLDYADAGHATILDKALTDSKVLVKDQQADGYNADGYDASNPTAWIAKNLTDSKTSPYAGNLRNLLTTLAASQDVKDLAAGKTAATLAKGADMHTMTASVTPGIYLILDLTATGRASIPMLTGTGVAGKTTLKNGEQTFTLGQVEYKSNATDTSSNATTVTKKILVDGKETDANAARIGGTVTYRLTTTVPNWTGYAKYRFQLADTLSAGLDYQSVSKATVTPKNGQATNLTATQYKATPAADKHSVTFLFAPATDGKSDLIAMKNVFPVDATVTIEYTAVLNKDAQINDATGGKTNTNTAKVQYSHNPNAVDDLETTNGNTVNTYTGRLQIHKHDAAGQALAGATFEVTQNGTALKFVDLKNGQYRLAAAGDQTTVAVLTTPATGDVTINGLSGAVTVTEKTSPMGATALPAFTLTVNPMKDKDGKKTNAVEQFQGDANQMATHKDGTELVDVLNVRNLLEMPHTGATWMLIWAMGAVLGLAGGMLLLRRNATR